MTIQDIIEQAGRINALILLVFFLMPPIITWIISKCHNPENGENSPWKYIYSVLVYLVCIPGIFSCILTAYTIFFIRQNILQVNLMVYFAPVICMIITLVIVSRHVEWSSLPGVDRLYALMIILLVSFLIALAIQKTRIWIFFGSSIFTLIIIAFICFGLLKWGTNVLFGSKPLTKKLKNHQKELEKLKKKIGI